MVHGLSSYAQESVFQKIAPKLNLTWSNCNVGIRGEQLALAPLISGHRKHISTDDSDIGVSEVTSVSKKGQISVGTKR